MKIRKIILAICAMVIVLSLAGCLSVEEKEALANFEQTAAKYYKEKYGETPDIQKCEYYIDYSGIFPQRTKDMYAKCSNDEYIIYDAERKIIVDNRQSKEADTAILAELTERLTEITGTIENGEILIERYNSSTYITDLTDSNFYHAFFNGDIERFMQDENIQLCANLYLICEKEDQWQEVQKICETLVRENFRTERNVTLTILSQDCHEKEGSYASIKHNECWAEFVMNMNSTDSYIQNYVKVVDGIYVTCAEKNFVFEENDVQLREVMSEQELNDLILQRYNLLPDKAPENANGSYMVHDKTREKYSIVSTSSPVYQLVFSDRVKEIFTSGEVAAYFRFNPDEVVSEEGDRIIKYKNTEDSYRCYSVTKDKNNISNWETVGETDCFFIGNYKMQGTTEKGN